MVVSAWGPDRWAAPAGTRRWRRVLPDAVIAVLCCAGSAALGLVSAAAADAQQVLSGEELSVSMVAVVSVPARFQPTVYATNFASHVYYWAFSELDPAFSLFYGRTAKAVAMSLLAPLVYVTARRRLGCGRPAAALAAAAAALLPGVSAFSWLATENGLEALWGLAGLYVATSRRRGSVAAPVLAGVAVSTYGAGLAWAGAILVVVAVRVVRRPWRARRLLAVLASTAAGAGIVLFPLLWWGGGGQIVVGGGTASSPRPGAAITGLLSELAVRGNSYYYFTHAPALGSLALAVVLGVALVAALVRRPRIWPWALVVLLTVLLCVFSGGVLGVRRAVAIPVVGALALGVATDLVARAVDGIARWLLAGVVALAVLVPLGVQYADDVSGWSTGRYALPVDWQFPIPPGRTMPEEFAAITAELNSGRTTYEQVAGEREGERTLATVWLLADRRGRSLAGLATPADIRRLVSEGPRCQHDCHPVPGRP